MPARLAYSWFYERILDVTGARKDRWAWLRIDAALGDAEADEKLRGGELQFLATAGGDVG